MHLFSNLQGSRQLARKWVCVVVDQDAVLLFFEQPCPMKKSDDIKLNLSGAIVNSRNHEVIF